MTGDGGDIEFGGGRRRSGSGHGWRESWDHRVDSAAGGSAGGGLGTDAVRPEFVPTMGGRRRSFGSTMDLVQITNAPGDTVVARTVVADGSEEDEDGGGGHHSSTESPRTSMERARSMLGGLSPSKWSSKKLQERAPKTKLLTSYQTKLRREQARDLLYVIFDDGTSHMREMSVRELYNYIMEEVTRSFLPLSLSAEGADVPLGRPTSVQFPNLDKTPQDSIRKRLSPTHARLVKSATSSPSVSSSLFRSDSRQGKAAESGFYLHHRDLRQLFSTNSASEPSIAVRRSVVLVNLETVRGIVMCDRVILLVDPGADSILQRVERELTAMSDMLPEFELRAYEALLSLSTSDLTRDVKEIEPLVREVVMLMEGPGSHAATSAQANDKFRGLMNEVNELDSRAKARRRALLTILEDDEDLSLMSLTKVKEHPDLYIFPLAPEVEEDHEEVELLLESYLQEVNSLGNVLELMRDRMHNTESLIMVKLDIARNQLLTASTIFSMVAMCSGFGALWAGIFGMNLTNEHESSYTWFVATTVIIVLTSFIIGVTTFLYLNYKGVWMK